MRETIQGESMLRLRRKSSGRAGVRAALLSGAAVAALGVSALGAGSAAAAPGCTGAKTITGQGASLQNIAQTKVWGPGFAGLCPGFEIKYISSGSGAGMEQWNHNNVTKSINTGLSWISTDDAPTAAQIGNIKSVAGGAQVAVIPVAQTAIAIVAHLPEGCLLEGVSNSNLAGIFEGRILTWNKVTGAEEEVAGACNAPITRVVRKDGSGTTFQFKNYLYQLNKEPLACTTGGAQVEGKRNWQEMEEIGAGGKPNIDWPESCTEKEVKKTLSPVARPAEKGGGELVKLVNATVGGIGYAALPDAKANAKAGTEILGLQNNGQKSEINLAKATGPSETANCGGATYTGFKLATGLDVDWSGVFGAKPAIGAKNYPLCTLTYALAFHGYKQVPPFSEVSFTEGQELTARDYLYEYVVQEAGQNAINSNYYSSLPSSAEERFDVLGAARKAAKTISY
jgi:ABC-type phosphate transport system substrate-binding protein